MKELLESMLKGMVDYPERIGLEEIRGSDNILYKVTADQTDIGKLIGKKGKHAEAIRTLFAAIGGKERKKVLIEFPK